MKIRFIQFIDTTLQFGAYRFDLKVNNFEGMMYLTHRFIPWGQSISGIFDVIGASEMEPEEALEMYASIVVNNHRELDAQLEHMCVCLQRQRLLPD